MTQTDALKLALEALEECKRDPRLKYEHPTYEKTITAIKEALAQPAVTESHKQRSVSEHLEPVAWRVRWPKVGGGHAWVMNDAPLMAEHGFVNEPLYTTPPYVATPRQRTTAEGEDTRRVWVEPREWRGLTDEEILSWWSMDNDLEDLDMCNIVHFRKVVEEVQAKLKKKNTK